MVNSSLKTRYTRYRCENESIFWQKSEHHDNAGHVIALLLFIVYTKTWDEETYILQNIYITMNMTCCVTLSCKNDHNNEQRKKLQDLDSPFQMNNHNFSFFKVSELFVLTCQLPLLLLLPCFSTYSVHAEHFIVETIIKMHGRFYISLTAYRIKIQTLHFNAAPRS